MYFYFTFYKCAFRSRVMFFKKEEKKYNKMHKKEIAKKKLKRGKNIKQAWLFGKCFSFCTKSQSQR